MAGSSPNTPALWGRLVTRPDPDVHKYQRGHCLIVSGPEFRTGASRLAAVAAMNSGAGAVTIAGNKAALRVHASHLTSIMLQPVTGPGELASWIADRNPSAAVIGPAAGVGRSTLGLLGVLLAAAVPVVIDADALTSLNGRPTQLAGRIQPLSPVVLTPHAGEFRRLFHDLDQDAGFRSLPDMERASKLEQTRAAARLVKGVVVFKGRETVIADEDGRAAVNTNAGPELAVAGSGDVLAGIIASHLAMGMPPFEAAASAVWLHAVTGADIGLCLTAEKLAMRVEPVFSRKDIHRC
jgi:ADP-dependent NAD(P)H-hydrate dehydratase / NAD(P)H-hydrate epimerase